MERLCFFLCLKNVLSIKFFCSACLIVGAFLTTYAQPPSITSFSPNTVCQGDAVTITGTNFTEATKVKLGSVDAASFMVNSSTSITAIVANTASGGTVTVTTPLGISPSGGFLTVLPAPRPILTDVSPGHDIDFTNCNGSSTYQLTVRNNSVTNGSNNIYTINWGDGPTVPLPIDWPTGAQTSHTYQGQGYFDIVLTITPANGCIKSITYRFYNGVPPIASWTTDPLTPPVGCAPVSVNFLIGNWFANSLGTSYEIDFGDGTPLVTLQHPLNLSNTDRVVPHTYNTSSCPATNFTATLRVRNACSPTPTTYTQNQIIIRKAPVADFSTSTSCAGAVCFTNLTTNGFSGSSCNTTTTYLWDFGDGTTSTLQTPPCHNYPAGTYTVKLTASNIGCGNDTKTKQITIADVPGVVLPSPVECPGTTVGPLSISTTGTFVSWTNPTTNPNTGLPYGTFNTNPIPAFTAINNTNIPQTATITIRVSNSGCVKDTSFKITVNPKPVIPDRTTTICSGNTFTVTPVNNNPQGTIVPAGTKYTWDIPVSIPVGAITGGSAQPVGQGSISQVLTNITSAPAILTYRVLPIAGAPGNCVGDSFTLKVTVNPKPSIPEQKAVICSGGSFTITPADDPPSVVIPSGTTYSWPAPVVGPGISGGAAGSNQTSIKGTLTNNGPVAQLAIYTVTPTSPGPCSGSSFKIMVTVYPKPAKPVVSCDRPIRYCLNDVAAPLCAIASPQNKLTWCTYNPLACSSDNLPVPRTDTIYSVCYGIYQQSDTSGCKSDTAQICVSVSPKISGNAIKKDTTLCSPGTSPGALGQDPAIPIGGSYTYQWQDSILNRKWQDISSEKAASYTPRSVNATTWLRRIAFSGSCSDTSNVIKIAIGNLPAPVIKDSQSICAGTVPEKLTGSSGGNNTFYQWEDSKSGISPGSPIPGATTPDYQPPKLYETTYYRRKDSSAGCISYSNWVKMTVYNKPVAGTIKPADTTVCTGSSVTLSTNTVDSIVTWQYNPAPTNDNTWINTLLPVFNNIQDSILARLIVVTKAYLKGCDFSDTSKIAIIKVSQKSSGGNTETGATVCSGANSGVITLTDYSGRIVRWESSTTYGVSWVSILNATPSLLYNNLDVTTWYRAVVKSDSCSETYSDTTIITVVKSVTPSNAGPDQKWCNVDSIQLSGSQPVVGTGVWKQIGSPSVNIKDGSLYNTSVTGLKPDNIYRFEWKITGSGHCAPSSDTVEIKIWPLTTNPNAGPDTTICDLVSTRTIPLHANKARSFETSRWVFASDSSGNSFENRSSPTSNFFVLNPGTHKLLWRISNDSTGGCPAKEDTVVIKVFEKPAAGSIVPASPSICAGDSITLSYIPVRGAIEKWQYNPTPSVINNWRDSTGTQAVKTFRDFKNNFGVRLIVIMPGAAPDCSFSDTSKPVFVTVNPIPPVAIKVSPGTVQEQPYYTFTFSDTLPDNTTYRYLWDLGDRTKQTRDGKTITYTYSDTGTFKVQLAVRDVVTNCRGLEDTNVKILYIPGYLYIPNAMCVGCSNNSLRQFLPLGKGLKEYRLRIYSKWGQLIFETTKLNPDGSPSEAWPGLPADKMPEQNSYMWVAEGKYTNGTEWKGMVYPPGNRHVKSGFITFIK